MVPPGLDEPRPSKTLALKRGSIRESPLSDRQAERDTAALHAGAAAIRFQGVSVDFPVNGGTSYPAVAKTDLQIGAHEFVAIVGPTGCGKSTLLNVAAGLLAPTTGQTLVFGAPLAGLNRNAGYLFQQDAVMPWKTARDNVAIGARDCRRCARRGAGARAGLAQARRAGGVRRPLSAPALGRTEEARRPRPGADPRSQDPADGRAVRAARCADAADHGQPAARTCGPATARPCCSSPTTWRRRSRCPTAW